MSSAVFIKEHLTLVLQVLMDSRKNIKCLDSERKTSQKIEPVVEINLIEEK